MSKVKAILLGSACSLLALSVATGAPPSGAGKGGKPDGVACQQAGISTLQSLGLLAAVAKDGIEVVGVGVLDFQTVLRLHRTNPELFAGGADAVTVVVPGVGNVVANWCS